MHNNRSILQLLRIETDGVSYKALVGQMTEEGEYWGAGVMNLDVLGGGIVQGIVKLNGYFVSEKERLLEKYQCLLVDNVDATLSTECFLIARTANGFLILDSDNQEKIVSAEELTGINLFNAHYSNNKLEFKTGEPLLFCTLHESIESKLADYMEFYKFTKKPGIVGRVAMSNSFSNELTKCKIVGGSSFRTYTLPRYIRSIGKDGLEMHGTWCELKFRPSQTVRYNSLKIENTKLQKIEMTSEQVCDSRLSFLESGGVTLSELCLLDIPNKAQLYIILDIISEQGRYVNLEGYLNPDCLPDTLGKRTIKSVSLKCPKKKTDYTIEIYEYSRALAKWYVQEFSQLFYDCFGQKGFVPSSEVVECTRYCIELLTKNLEIFATIADIMQPLCSEDLTCSETHSVYQLMDTLRVKMSGIIQTYVTERSE